MPGMILPSGEYAMVAHPTDWHKRPYIHVDGRWYHFNSRRGLSGQGITEFTVREAILNEGYRPVFFGLKIERPEPIRNEFTLQFGGTEATAATNEDAWAELNSAVREASGTFARLDEAMSDSYQRQMEYYQRWVTERASGGRATGGRTAGGYTVRQEGAVATWHYATEAAAHTSYAEPQAIENPYHDDTTRSYPTSEQITRTRRR